MMTPEHSILEMIKPANKERIAQLILEQCNTIGWVEVEELEDSVRSDGGFGSTGS